MYPGFLGLGGKELSFKFPELAPEGRTAGGVPDGLMDPGHLGDTGGQKRLVFLFPAAVCTPTLQVLLVCKSWS